MNQLKEEDSELKPYPWCLGTVKKNLAANNMKKKILGSFFSIYYGIVDY